MHEHLPVHPRTGLRAVGVVAGRPVWPILGGSEQAGDPPDPPAAPADSEPAAPASAEAESTSSEAGDPPTGSDDEPLGESGKKALDQERSARKQLEKQLSELAPLKKIAEALGQGDPAKGKTEIEQITERMSTLESQLSEAQLGQWRAEIAQQHGFTAEQASELRGQTREELAAHADRLKQLFPSAPEPTGQPKPDPSQGGRSGAGLNLDTQIQEAQRSGDYRKVIALQNQKLAEQ